MTFEDLYAAFTQLYGEREDTHEQLLQYWHQLPAHLTDDPFQLAEAAAQSQLFTEYDSTPEAPAG